MRAEIVRRRLDPQLREIQRRYKKNPELVQRKTLELYAIEKASPFAGILPALAQAPVISLLYGLFTQPTIAGHANGLLAAQVFGVPLGAHAIALVWPGILLFVGVLAIIAAVAVMSRRVQLRYSPPDATAPALARWLSWLPLITVVFAAFLPLAAALYLAVTTAWTLGERAVIRRLIDVPPARLV